MSVTDLMMEHPWMTFFVAMTLAGGIADALRRMARTRDLRARFEASRAESEAAHARARESMNRPHETACSRCGSRLMFSARQRLDVLCGPCSRAR